uniref:WRKY19-like zinc finger domain-containing protein n=1 Tax=Globisporangium ultimum (strain ATCC 200006 / CBS 805.95 / DAOM BR144) TaxID=431595 RepID=K3XBW2_GLOUD
MHGSGVRNISFQGLFEHAAAAPVPCRTSPRHAVPRPPSLLARVVPHDERQLIATHRLSHLAPKSSIGFILGGLAEEATEGDRQLRRHGGADATVPAACKTEQVAYNAHSLMNDLPSCEAMHRHQYRNSVNYSPSLSDRREENEDDEDSYMYERQSREEVVRSPSLTAARQSPSDQTDAPGKRKKKRKARICKESGCDKYVVDHGLCIRHGGGKRCNVEDCNCRAQNRGLCWKHGGYTICKIEGCTKRAKSRGICWSHGGGTRCKAEGCTKIAVSLGRCWAHGGGKRCIVEGCKKPASERTNNCCTDHFGWFQQDGIHDA